MRNKNTLPRCPIFVVGPSIAYIPLTRGAYALIDAEDAGLVSDRCWHLLGQYAGNHSGGKRSLMHRALCESPKGVYVDHQNRNPLDNRRVNLRQSSPSQNTCNSKIRKDNSSGYKGVRYKRNRGYWAYQIQCHGRTLHGNGFSSAEAAHIARSKVAKELHREFYCAGI